MVFGIGRVHKLKFTGRCTSTISLRVQEADVLYVSEERVGNRLVSAEDWGVEGRRRTRPGEICQVPKRIGSE